MRNKDAAVTHEPLSTETMLARTRPPPLVTNDSTLAPHYAQALPGLFAPPSAHPQHANGQFPNHALPSPIGTPHNDASHFHQQHFGFHGLAPGVPTPPPFPYHPHHPYHQDHHHYHQQQQQLFASPFDVASAHLGALISAASSPRAATTAEPSPTTESDLSSRALNNQSSGTFETSPRTPASGAPRESSSTAATNSSSSSSSSNRRSKTGSTPMSSSMSTKDAVWVLDSLEEYHTAQLSQEQQQLLSDSGLRQRPKHRSAIVFKDDADFVVAHSERRNRFEQAEFDRSAYSDSRVFLLHAATLEVLLVYRRSLLYAPAKSAVWSALMFRVEYYLRRSGYQDVRIEDQVVGVRHKEATLFVQGYHISRSNFTKLCRQLLAKKLRAVRAQRETANTLLGVGAAAAAAVAASNTPLSSASAAGAASGAASAPAPLLSPPSVQTARALSELSNGDRQQPEREPPRKRAKTN